MLELSTNDHQRKTIVGMQVKSFDVELSTARGNYRTLETRVPSSAVFQSNITCFQPRASSIFSKAEMNLANFFPSHLNKMRIY